MNERIDQLWGQALDQAVPETYTQLSHSQVLKVKQVFAELIVRECADLFVDRRYMVLNPLEPFAYERVRVLKEHDKDTVKKIKQHFGVEL